MKEKWKNESEEKRSGLTALSSRKRLPTSLRLSELGGGWRICLAAGHTGVPPQDQQLLFGCPGVIASPPFTPANRSEVTLQASQSQMQEMLGQMQDQGDQWPGMLDAGESVECGPSPRVKEAGHPSRTQEG